MRLAISTLTQTPSIRSGLRLIPILLDEIGRLPPRKGKQDDREYLDHRFRTERSWNLHVCQQDAAFGVAPALPPPDASPLRWTRISHPITLHPAFLGRLPVVKELAREYGVSVGTIHEDPRRLEGGMSRSSRGRQKQGNTSSPRMDAH